MNKKEMYPFSSFVAASTLAKHATKVVNLLSEVKSRSNECSTKSTVLLKMRKYCTMKFTDQDAIWVLSNMQVLASLQ